MKIRFHLIDNDCEHLMYMYGSDYIPDIGEDVLFNDVKNDVYIDELAKVIGKYYKINENMLTIECEIYNQPNDYGYSQFDKYNS